MPSNHPVRPTRSAGPLAGRASAAAAAALALALLTGCQSARVPQPPLAAQLTPATGNTDSAQIEFWHALSDRPLASNDDALHALLLYFDTKDDAADYAARVQALKSRKWLAADFNEPADRAVSRGTVAAALARALHFKGG